MNSDRTDFGNESHAEPRDTPEQRLMDSLLTAAFRPDSSQDVELRVSSVMRAIHLLENSGGATALGFPLETDRGHAEISAGPELRTDSVRPGRQPIRAYRWFAWCAAASVVFGLFVLYQATGTNRAAWAAVERSLAAASTDSPRKYSVTIETHGPPLGRRDISCDLWVQGNDRFVLRHPALIPGTSLWLGQEGELTWVAPAIGPVRVGSQTGLGKWLASRQEVATPYLQITTILDRMGQGYRLESLPHETISSGLSDPSEMVCQHIRGRLKPRLQGRDLPDTIDLWAEAEGGLAVRLVLSWNQPAGALGRKRIELGLSEVGTISKDWFDYRRHAGNRRVMQLDDSAE